MTTLKKRNLDGELWFHTSRSQGKGGQHVNKASTKVELFFNIRESRILDEQQKNLLGKKLAHKISAEGNLRIISQATRSAFDNKTIAIERFYRLLEKALQPKTPRIPTGPTKHSKENRLKSKRIRGEKKQLRQHIRGEE